MLHSLRPPVGIMNLEVLGTEHPASTCYTIEAEEGAEPSDRDPLARRENTNASLLQRVTELPRQNSVDSSPSHRTSRQSVATPPESRDHASLSSENRLGGSQNPLQSSQPSSEQGSELPSFDFADPKRVPGTDQNIYPHATIGREFHDRYSQVVDVFKQAVDTHKFLKHHTSEINYELRLCGSCPSTAGVSIVVFCTDALFKHLRSLLSCKHIRRQYQSEAPSVNRLPFASRRHHLQAPTSIVVRFRVVFWRAVTTPTERRSAMEQVVAQNRSCLSMCGSLVRYGDRISTLGLLLSVDSKLYGLTVDHLFRRQRDEERSIVTREPNIPSDGHNAEDNRPDGSWVDDVTYEDLYDNQKDSDDGSMASGLSPAAVTMDRAVTENGDASITGHRVDSVREADLSTPYLDWALIEFENGYFERPNAFYLEDDPLHPKFFTKLSASPETSRVRVFMVSGVSGTREGVMLNSYSYIGGTPGEKLCQAWNVILSDSAREW